MKNMTLSCKLCKYYTGDKSIKLTDIIDEYFTSLSANSSYFDSVFRISLLELSFQIWSSITRYIKFFIKI
jgi:hypothetical protein